MSGLAPPLVLLCAIAIDTLYGEWPGAVHPVVWMGRAVRRAERRAPAGDGATFAWGIGMALGLPTLWAGAAWGTGYLAGAALGDVLGFVVAVYSLKSSFAMRVLGEAGRGVAVPLQAGDLDAARLGLRSLCSRDASALDAAELAAGTIESLAENLSDSLVAPLFWFCVGGVPAAVAYRAVNTLDAMIGYRGKYEWLGKASARLDDLLNLVPARLTAGLLLAGGALVGGNVSLGVRVLRRDRGNTESPNAGWPMAVMSGLVGVKLEKPGYYTLGTELRAPTGADVAQAWRICTAAAWLGLFAGALPALGLWWGAGLWGVAPK